MYGMSMRPVPETWEDFQEYWEAKCRDELEINKATLDILGIRIEKMSSVALLISSSSRHLASQYSWKSSHVSGTGRMLMPYIRYHCTCSSKSWCFSASVSP